MTVKELIAKLTQMPENAVVVIDMMSECIALDDDEPKLVRAEEKRLVLRNGQYMSYVAAYWPKTEKPHFVTVCHFPGN